MRRRNDGHANGQAGRKQAVERTHGSHLSRLVGIETKDYFIHVALYDASVVGGERGSLRGYNVLNSGHKTGNQIKLAFAHQGKARVQHRAFRFVEAEEHFALREYERLRRVHILRRLFVTGKHAATERDHSPLLVANREDEPPAKPVVIMVAAFLPQNQPSLLHEWQLVTLVLRPIDRVVPQIGRIAQPKELHRFL